MTSIVEGILAHGEEQDYRGDESNQDTEYVQGRQYAQGTEYGHGNQDGQDTEYGQGNQDKQDAEYGQGSQNPQDTQEKGRKKFENKEERLRLNKGDIRVLIAAILLDPNGFADHVKVRTLISPPLHPAPYIHGVLFANRLTKIEILQPVTKKLAESCGYSNTNTANSVFYYAKEKVKLIARRGGEGALAINAIEMQPKKSIPPITSEWHWEKNNPGINSAFEKEIR
jgi:hypothetical protein